MVGIRCIYHLLSKIFPRKYTANGNINESFKLFYFYRLNFSLDPCISLSPYVVPCLVTQWKPSTLCVLQVYKDINSSSEWQHWKSLIRVISRILPVICYFPERYIYILFIPSRNLGLTPVYQTTHTYLYTLVYNCSSFSPFGVCQT